MWFTRLHAGRTAILARKKIVKLGASPFFSGGFPRQSVNIHLRILATEVCTSIPTPGFRDEIGVG